MPGTIFRLLVTIVGSSVLTSAAIFVIVKFLLKPIWTALNGYTTTYASGQASIDVRIRNLEKLAEEQARLTRTVESIKDEIAAQAKSRDDRWAFKKEVYTNLILATTDMISVLAKHLHLDLSLEKQGTPPEIIDARLTQALSEDREALDSSVKAFVRYANLAPLATADSVTPLVLASADQLTKSYGGPNTVVLAKQIANFTALRQNLQAAGRKDLWDTLETEAGTEAAKRT